MHPVPPAPTVSDHRGKEQDKWLRRRRLERQLHDGAALRISALTLRLGLLRHRCPPNEPAWRDRIGELQDELHAILDELRDVASAIYPPLLDEAGLGPALHEVASRLEKPVVVVVSGERYGPSAEGAAYFSVVECLTSLPAGAPAIQVVGRREDDDLVLSVTGVNARDAEFMDDRIRPLGGTVHLVDGNRCSASTITARIPCE